jgi:hypothetical protein
MTETDGICGSVNGTTGNRCLRKPGHKGMHQGTGPGRWGGETTWRRPVSSYRPIKLRTAEEEQRVSCGPPTRPPAGKFTDIPGQQAMDFSRDERYALTGGA